MGTERIFNMSRNAATGIVAVDQTNRQKWDIEKYKNKAEERERMQDAEKEANYLPAHLRTPVKAREAPVVVERNVGTRKVLAGNDGLKKGGFFCEVCDCVLKDSQAYLNHVNGKKHQRAIGHNLRVEHATLDQVKNRFDYLKRKREEKSEEFNYEAKLAEMRKKEEEDRERRKEERKKRKEEKKAAKQSEPTEDGEMAMMAAMGLPVGFDSTKK